MATGVGCPDVRKLEALMAGRAPWAEIEWLAGHLENCDQCANTVHQMQVSDALAGSIVHQGLAAPDPEAGVVQDLIGRVAALYTSDAAGDGAIDRAPAQNSPAAPAASATDTVEDHPSLLSPPEEPDEIGRLGAYRVLSVIAKGGMGIVYQAQHRQLKRMVAIKMILAGPRAGHERIVRFRRESELVAGLQHSNIVQIFEVGEHNGQPFFAMELVNGGSLAETLRVAPLAARAAVELAETLARAMQFAHQRGVIHRDLKPANVLLVSGGVVSG